MEWRIRENGHGEFVAEKGIPHAGGARIPGMIGYTMPAFILYESSTFKTRRQAEKYIERQQKRRCF